MRHWPSRLAGTCFIAALGVSLASAGGTSPEAPAAGPQPNFVVVMTDDQALRDMTALRLTRRLVFSRGTRFNHSFVNFPLCCPSRATFLTGQYAHNHGVQGNNPPLGGFPAFDDRHSLALWLRDAGYSTALIGKYLNGYGSHSPRYVPPGWTHWAAMSNGTTWDAYDYDLNINGRLVHYGDRASDFKQDVVTERATHFIRRRARGSRPFLAFLSYTAPHDSGPHGFPGPPYDCGGMAKAARRHAHAFDRRKLQTVPSFNERDVSDKPSAVSRLPQITAEARQRVHDDMRCRQESLLSVDEGVRRVIRTLRATGELGHTYVFFTSDNGFMQGEHRIPRGKGQPYEESIRVPLAVRGPAFGDGVAVKAPVINADLAPTIARLAGAAPDVEMDGTSLVEVAADPEAFRGRSLLIDLPGEGIAIRTPRYYYGHARQSHAELYDLRRDPFELRSQHDNPRYGDRRRALSRQLRELSGCAGASCRS